MTHSLAAAGSGAGLIALLLATTPVQAETDTRTITLIHMNDLHAHLVPHLDLVRVASDGGAPPHMQVAERGGLARIATLIRRIREDNPDSLLMNVGDTYHGGVEALYTRGNAIVAPVDALGIDVGVPGNWDFAYAPLVTRLRYAPEPSRLARFVNWLLGGDPVERPGFPNLAANLTLTFPPFQSGENLLPGTAVLELGGVQVGFIGLTADIVPRMAKPMGWGFDFLQGEDAYRTLVDRLTGQLREAGAEIVVVMSELGLHKDRRLADVVQSGVDVFFSAHTHEVTPVPLASVSGALVVEAGNDGALGRMDLTLRDGAVVDRRWRLIEVDASIPEDPAVAELVAAARAPFLASDLHMEHPMPWVDLPLRRPIDTVVGRTDVLLHRRNALENPFNDLLAETMRRSAGTQVALSPGFRFDAIVPPATATSGGAASATGEITLEQLFRYLPVAPTLAVGEIRGGDLEDVLETELTRVFSPDAFAHSGGWFLGVAGLEIDMDLTRADGERILAMRSADSGDAVEEDDVISVASCVRPFDDEGTMCSNGGFHAVEPFETPETGRAWTPAELLLHALEAGEAATPAHPRITDRGATQQWPIARFVQPLREDAPQDGT